MGSGGKQKTQVNQTTTQTPQVPSWIQGPYQDFASQVGGLLNNAPDPSTYMVGANANQRAAFAGAGGAGGSNWMTQGLTGLQNVGDVNYDSLAGADLSPYMNPYQQNVIDLSLDDLNRSRERAITSGQAQATASGAYGGSRHGVADSLTNREFADSAGLLSANLRSQGYNNAQQGAMFDINNRYTAGIGNRNAAFTRAQGLISGGAQLDENQRANIAQLAQMGAEERQIAMQNNPELARLAYLASVGGLLGQIPTNTFTGSTSNTTGTTTGSYSPGLLDWVNAAANVVGAFKGG